MKIGIMTDVNAGLDYLGYDTQIPCLRSTVNFKEKSYVDGIDIHADEFYQRISEIKKASDIPSTSAPSIADIYDKLDTFVKEGYTDVIHFPISFALSSTGETVQKIAEEYKGKLNVYVINTKAAAYLQGYIALTAKKMADEGASVEEIIQYANYLIEHNHAYFVVNNLEYLVKNGRLSNSQGVLGTLFKIKPILEINKEGKIVAVEKVRIYQKALEKSIQLILDYVKDAKKAKMLIFHSLKEDSVAFIKSELLNRRPDLCTDLEIHFITPAVGAHIGAGVVAVGAFILE